MKSTKFRKDEIERKKSKLYDFICRTSSISTESLKKKFGWSYLKIDCCLARLLEEKLITVEYCFANDNVLKFVRAIKFKDMLKDPEVFIGELKSIK